MCLDAFPIFRLPPPTALLTQELVASGWCATLVRRRLLAMLPESLVPLSTPPSFLKVPSCDTLRIPRGGTLGSLTADFLGVCLV